MFVTHLPEYGIISLTLVSSAFVIPQFLNPVILTGFLQSYGKKVMLPINRGGKLLLPL